MVVWRRKLIKADAPQEKIRRSVTMEDGVHSSDGKMYDHNKLLSLYQTDINSARLYLDEHIWYFLNRVSWQIYQNEFHEMRAFAIPIIDDFAQRQIHLYEWREAWLKLNSRSDKKEFLDAVSNGWKIPKSEWWNIEWKSADSNKIGRYLVITLRFRLKNMAAAKQKWNDIYQPIDPEDLGVEIEEKDEITISSTYNIIGDAILSLWFNEQQIIWIHMSMIGWSSDVVCAWELWMELKEFRNMMKQVKHLIQKYIYDNTNTLPTQRWL